VFGGRRGGFSPAPALPQAWADLSAMAAALAECRNDLEAPARALCPAIGEVLAALAATQGCRLARMSGSGATCFGLFDDAAAAAAAATALRQPRWWVSAG
jgi:4-diphosphocytidyl-2-C-methyl-D-erythritol kinase